MALKKQLNDDESYGLSPEEIKHAEKYLRKYKTKGAIPEVEALKLYELYMVGVEFSELRRQFPQYQLGQIILTAALAGWAKDRDRMQDSLRDRVQAKIIKSVLEQVDYLTTQLSVTNVEQMDEMRRYIIDPDNNPKPQMRISSLKEYKEVVETLHKLVVGASGGKKNGVLDTLEPKPTAPSKPPIGYADLDEEEDEWDLDAALAEENKDDNQEKGKEKDQ